MEKENNFVMPILKSNNRSEIYGTVPPEYAAKKTNDDKNFPYLSNLYESIKNGLTNKFRIKNQIVREFLAELFGTFIFLSFALASIAQYKLGNPDQTFNQANFLSVNISFGLGLTLAIIVVGNISGGHLNPAVSFSMLLIRQINFWKFSLYVIAQSIGAFLASIMVFLVYEVQIRKKYFPMYTLETASIFATYPIDLSDSNVLFYFVDEVFATALFIIMVLAITDKKNDLQQPFVALFIGLALLTIGTSYGYNSGFALNPVRDFWPRVFTSLAGWGSSPFTACNYFFWIPLVGPMVGSLIATIIYSLFISNHHRFESFQQF